MKSVLILFLIVSGVSTHAQQFEKLETVALDFNTVYAAIDRAGDVYALSKEGDIEKVGATGVIEARNKLKHFPTLFDPRDGSHLFLYWRNNQTYTSLLPTLEANRAELPIDSAIAAEPFLVCPSGDHDLIILDRTDWSLKKINGKTNTVLYETIIYDGKESKPGFEFLREYQNFIFLLDSGKGIHVFNMMGKLLKTIGDAGIQTFSSLGEELYYLRGDTLYFFNLFTSDTRTLKLPKAADFAFLTDERLFLINGDRLDLYSVK